MFSFTIIQSAQRDKFANKTIKSLGDLGVSKSDYGNVYWWFFQPQTRHSLGAMVELLRMLARRPEAALIMGAPKPGVDLQRPRCPALGRSGRGREYPDRGRPGG